MTDEISPNEYQRLAIRTESRVDFLTEAAATAMAQSNRDPHHSERIIHAILGIASEVGELTDALKKHLFYGKALDRTNLKEEAGDALWYLAILLAACGFTMDDAMRSNIAKLQRRYPDKFDAELAQNRDLDAERAALEGSDQR